MPGRRQFLIACSYLAAAPAFVATLFTAGDVQAAINAAPGSDGESAATLNTDAPLMQIQGWESPGDTENTASDQMWIRMNSSWRGAWR
jgi:hypothetical protein